MVLKTNFLWFCRIGIIEKDNEKLQQQLQELRSKRQRKEELEREVAEPPKRELKKDRRLIPGIYLNGGISQHQNWYLKYLLYVFL